VREALQVYVQKIDRKDIGWEAASEAVLERLDKARQRLAERWRSTHGKGERSGNVATAAERVGDMTRDELRQLIRDTFLEIWDELLQETDPDAGLSFRPEVAASLRKFLSENPQGTPLADVRKELGLDG
jgi:hypothetical protein